MKQLPVTDSPLVLRTDFSDQIAWETICAAIRHPVRDLIVDMDFFAEVEFVDDTQYADIDKEQLLQLVPEDYAHSFIVIVDHSAISRREYPLLVIDLYDESGREFRTIPSKLQAIENNLSIANMDFSDFVDNVDASGVFRGFSEFPYAV